MQQGLNFPASNQPGPAKWCSRFGSGLAATEGFIHQEELKRLTFRFSRSSAVQRTYTPQGFFGLLSQDLTLAISL